MSKRDLQKRKETYKNEKRPTKDTQKHTEDKRDTRQAPDADLPHPTTPGTSGTNKKRLTKTKRDLQKRHQNIPKTKETPDTHSHTHTHTHTHTHAQAPDADLPHSVTCGTSGINKKIITFILIELFWCVSFDVCKYVYFD